MPETDHFPVVCGDPKQITPKKDTFYSGTGSHRQLSSLQLETFPHTSTPTPLEHAQYSISAFNS